LSRDWEQRLKEDERELDSEMTIVRNMVESSSLPLSAARLSLLAPVA